MDVKAVTVEEAQVVNQFLTSISYSAPGTMDAQYETLSHLISFRAKVRQALAVATQKGEQTDDETSGPGPGEE